MKYYAIIVAGGAGNRMNSDIPKQFLPVQGKPVLMHTIEAFYHSEYKPEIILVLNSAFNDYWEKLCSLHHFTIPFILVKNGQQRFDSVKNGLEVVAPDSVVAIHDAVRPVISNDLISRLFTLAKTHSAVIPAIPTKDSVRIVTGRMSRAIKREEVFLVQTPQVFQYEVLSNAYQQQYQEAFTDDASVVEAAGEIVIIIEGEQRNIKITYPEDLLLAEFYLSGK